MGVEPVRGEAEGAGFNDVDVLVAVAVPFDFQDAAKFFRFSAQARELTGGELRVVSGGRRARVAGLGFREVLPPRGLHVSNEWIGCIGPAERMLSKDGHINGLSSSSNVRLGA